MSNNSLNSENAKGESMAGEGKSNVKPESYKLMDYAIKSDMADAGVAKNEWISGYKIVSYTDNDLKVKNKEEYSRAGSGADNHEYELNKEQMRESAGASDASDASSLKNENTGASESSLDGEYTENEERRSRRTAAINQRLLMKKLASDEPNIEPADESPEVKKRKKIERRTKPFFGSSDESYSDSARDSFSQLEKSSVYQSIPKHIEEHYPEYVNDEFVPQEVLDNPGEIYTFNDHEIKRKIKKVLVNKGHLFVQGLRYIDDYLASNRGLIENDNESFRRMVVKNVEIDPEYFLQFGGYYEDLNDQVDSVNKMIESLQHNLSELHSEMGKSQMTKINEPSVLYSFAGYTTNIKDKTLEYEDILEEMKDFQDLVNDEHKEKRKLFKNLIMGTSKQMLKIEQELQKNDSERMKQVLLLYKNVSNMIDLFWKKIEKFAWEHLKKDLQQELIKKKKQNLDKFIQDAIKVSINDQERYIFDKKVKGSFSDLNRAAVSESESEQESEDSDVKVEAGNKQDKRKLPVDTKDKHKAAAERPTKRKLKPEKKAKQDATSKPEEEDEVEEEYVFDKDEQKMELDDLKLEEEMDSDKEENELNDLQKDLEMPLEELLKMYQQGADPHSLTPSELSSEEADSNEDQQPAPKKSASDAESEAEPESQEHSTNNLSEVTHTDEKPEFIRPRRHRSSGDSVSSSSKAVASGSSEKSVGSAAHSGTASKGVDNEDEELLEDEYVFDKEEEKMELDDLKLEEEMDSDKEENELDDLQKDLEMPLEELLKMYQQGAEDHDSDEVEESSEPTDDSSDYEERPSRSGKQKRGKRQSTSQVPSKKGPRASPKSSNPSEDTTHTSDSRDEFASKTGAASPNKDGAAEGLGNVKIPFLIKAVLRPYQKEGLGWLVSLYERGINGILADEMGLGKTLQTISLLAYLACYKENWGPHIIIVPTSILLNWVMEFNRFCPGFKVLAYYGSPSERARKRSGWNRPHSFNVMVSSYSIVVQDAYVLKRRTWEYMILDEAQNIKNFHSKRWQTLLTFNTKYRLLLTGTPLQNSLQELWSLMHFILPNIFTSHTQFNIWFTDPLNQALDNLYSSNPLYKNEIDPDSKQKEEMNKNNMELVEKLHVIFRPYLLRRLKKDVEKQMPSKYEHVLKCTLTKRQQVLYDEFISLYNLNSKGLDKEKLSYRSMLNILMQLRKICNHPDQLKSREVQIPIEFNIEPLQLPSMFKIVESGSLFDRRNGQLACEAKPERSPTSKADSAPPGTSSDVSLVASASEKLKSERSARRARYKSARCLRVDGGVSDDSSQELNTPSVRSDVGSDAGYAGRDNMVSPIVSSYDSSRRFGNSTAETSPANASYNSPVRRTRPGSSVYNSPASLNSPSNLLNGVELNNPLVNGLCLDAFKRRRDRLILDKKVKRRKLDLNFNSECLIQYSAVSDPNVIDFGTDLTGCGYSFNHGKTFSNGVAGACGSLTKLTSAYLSNSHGDAGPLAALIGTGCDLNTTSLTHANIAHRLESVFNFNLRNDLEINKLIEAYFTLVINFLVVATKVVSRPVELFFSGQAGINHNNRSQWHIKALTTKMLRRDDREYFAKNLLTLEAVNSHYRLLFPSKRALNDDCGKFRVLGPLLLRLKAEGHRCIIYTQFSKMLDILENWINFMGFTYTRLDGSTKIDMRQKIVNRFNENTKIFLFISSTRSGGVGITLTGADTVIFYDTDWNPAIDRQAMDRCHRIGQTKDVNVYRLISEHTVEENIWRKQLQKRKLDDLIVDQGQFDIQHNTWFSNIDTLINIFQNKKEEGEEDIYGKTILHESNVEGTNLKGTGVKSLKMLIEVEDADDSMALQKLTKENEKINKEDFENDMINTIPALVTYCIKFLLKYQTEKLEKQVEIMKLKIQVEDYQNKQDEEEDEDDIYTDYSSNDEAAENSNEDDQDEYESD